MQVKRPAKDLLEKLYDIPTASLCDALDKSGFSGFMSHEVKPIIEDVKIVGPAVTIKEVLSEKAELPTLLLEAIDHAEPGDVIVRGVEGDAKDIALWGGLMATAAKVRGLSGAVVDGGTRDVAEIRQIGFQIFSRSIVPSNSVGRTRVVDINVPIRCGGVPVSPGDAIVGDNDGVVVIPKELLEATITMALEMDKIEKEETEELKQGKSFIETIKKYARV